MRSNGWGMYTSPFCSWMAAIVSAMLMPRSIRSVRNMPITSPCEVLTSSPTITVMGLFCDSTSPTASSAPEISL